jgi:hypothetical protein
MIRKQTLFLVAAVASIGFATQAHAQQGVAQSFQSKGTNVGAFINFGPGVVCADGSEGFAQGLGFVFASDFISHQPGDAPSSSGGGSVDIFGYYDSCTGTSIGFGIAGFGISSYNPPQPALVWSSVSVNTPIQNLDNGASYPMNVDLKLRGQGPLSSEKGTTVYHQLGPYTVIIQRGDFTSRNAGVTGTITINGSMPDFTASGTLAGNSSASVLVQKPQ